MTRRFFSCIFVVFILISSSYSQRSHIHPLQIFNSNSSNPNIFSKFLMFIGIKPGYNYNLIGIFKSLNNLHKKNITVIYQQCYDQHEKAFDDIQRRIFNDPEHCVLDPVFTMVDNINNTYGDLHQSVAVLRKAVGDFRNGSRIVAMLELTTEEEEFIVDIFTRISVIKNTAFSLIDIPTCCYRKMRDLYTDFKIEIRGTVNCVKEGLAKDDTESGGVEVASTGGSTDEGPATTGGKDDVVAASGSKDEVAAATGGKDEVPPATGGEDEVPAATGGEDEVPAATGDNDKVPATSGSKDEVSATTGIKDELPAATGGKDKVPVVSGGIGKVPAITGIKDQLSAASNVVEDIFPPLISPQGWRPIRGPRL